MEQPHVNPLGEQGQNSHVDPSQLLGNFAGIRQAVMDPTDPLHDIALTSIIVPEAMVANSARTEQQLAEVTDEASSAAFGYARGIDSDESAKVGNALSNLEFSLQRAQSALQSVEEWIQSRRHGRGETEDIHGVSTYLLDFGQEYGQSSRVITAGYEDRNRTGVMTRNRLEDAENDARQLAIKLGRSEEDIKANPSLAYDDEVADAVIARQAGSVEEHEAACGQELEESHDRIGEAHKGILLTFDLADKALEKIQTGLKEGDKLPHANYITDGIQYLRQAMYSIGQDPTSFLNVQVDIDTLRGQLLAISQSVSILKQNDSEIQQSAAEFNSAAVALQR